MAVDPNVDPFKDIGGGVRLASGDWVMRGMTGSEGPQWGSQPGQTPVPGSPQGGPSPTGPVNSAQALTQQSQAQPTTVAGAFQSALLNRLSAPPVTAQSPQVQPAIQANREAEGRNYDRNRAMLAERNAAQGLNNSGGNEAMIRGLAQDRALREGQFAGAAVQDANRQQDVIASQLLGMTGGLLSDQDRLALQRYGMDLDANLRREGLGASTSLGQSDLALRDKLGTGNLNLGMLGLLQGGQQFGQSLASQNAQFSAGLNQAALLNMLGGL